MSEKFEIVGRIDLIETIAVGNQIREIRRLREMYGHGRWRKLKGLAIAAFPDGRIRPRASLYEAHGIGRRKLKLKDT